MTYSAHDERRSFLFFLMFILLTAGVLAFGDHSPLLSGVLGIVWGLFGFFRLFYISQYGLGALTPLVSLPSKILFGLERQEDARRAFVFKRFASLDVVLFLFIIMVFAGWAIYCSVDPAQVKIVQTLHDKQGTLVDFKLSNRLDIYALMMGLSYFGMIGIIICTCLSYGHSETALRWSFYALFPAFLFGAVAASLLLPPSSPALWVHLDILKGGGLGQADILGVLAPEMMARSGSGLVRRFTEMGMIGSYGVYVMLIPAFLMIIKMYFKKGFTVIQPSVALVCMALLLALDVFWVAAPAIRALSVLGLAIIALHWGAAKRFDMPSH